jgi:hypothetical protein
MDTPSRKPKQVCLAMPSIPFLQYQRRQSKMILDIPFHMNSVINFSSTTSFSPDALI